MLGKLSALATSSFLGHQSFRHFCSSYLVLFCPLLSCLVFLSSYQNKKQAFEVSPWVGVVYTAYGDFYRYILVVYTEYVSYDMMEDDKIFPSLIPVYFEVYRIWHPLLV